MPATKRWVPRLFRSRTRKPGARRACSSKRWKTAWCGGLPFDRQIHRHSADAGWHGGHGLHGHALRRLVVAVAATGCGRVVGPDGEHSDRDIGPLELLADGDERHRLVVAHSAHQHAVDVYAFIDSASQPCNSVVAVVRICLAAALNSCQRSLMSSHASRGTTGRATRRFSRAAPSALKENKVGPGRSRLL